MPGHTLSLPGEGDQARAPVPAPHLFLVLRAAAPREPAARYRLGAAEEVQLGRGRERRERHVDRTLEVKLPDSWMSSEHARLVRDERHWTLVDAGSKNGTRVNGTPTREA